MGIYAGGVLVEGEVARLRSNEMDKNRPGQNSWREGGR